MKLTNAYEYTREERAIALEIRKFKMNASYHKKRAEQLAKEQEILKAILRDMLAKRGCDYSARRMS